MTPFEAWVIVVIGSTIIGLIFSYIMVVPIIEGILPCDYDCANCKNQICGEY